MDNMTIVRENAERMIRFYDYFEQKMDSCDKEGGTVSREVLENIVDLALYNKKPILDVFEKFPTYESDRMRVRFDVELIRPIQENEVIQLLENLRHESPVIRDIYAIRSKGELVIDDFYKLLFERHGYKVGKGTSFSKALSKVITEKRDAWKEKYIDIYGQDDWNRSGKEMPTYKTFNRQLTMIGDVLNETKLNQTWYLSVNPYDFARMSDGSTWSSCHAPDGCYRSGVVSYMLDNMSAIFYMENEDGQLISRQWVGVLHNALHFNRIYGVNQTNATVISTHIKKAFDDVFNEVSEYEFDTSRGSLRSWDSATHYRDYSDYNSHILTYQQSYLDFPRDEKIGRTPICLSCGNEHESSGFLFCEDCRPSQQCCEVCGEYHLQDNMTYVDGHGWYCDYHFNEYFRVCSDCGEVIKTKGRNQDNYIIVGDKIICEPCSDTYYYCEGCHEYYHIDDIVFTTEDTHVIKGTYCTYCADDRLLEEEEETESECD